MNATRMMLCAIGATLMTSATVFGASASTVDGQGARGHSVSSMLNAQGDRAMAQTEIGNRSAASGMQLALNPQPLPPIVDDDRYDW